MQGMVPLCGFGGVPYSAVRKAAPRNLLDNSDFRNPVNQRGKTSYTDAGYTLDRWISSSVMPVNVSSNGITLDGTNGSIVLTQIIDGLDDGVYTFAAKVNGSISLRVYKKEGTTYTRLDATPNYTGGYLQMLTYSSRPSVQIRANSGYVVNLEWAALYEGEYTAETLPEYQPKGYGAELYECMRYFQKLSYQSSAAICPQMCYNTSNSFGVLYFPVPMRVVPTVSYTGTARIYTSTGDILYPTNLAINSNGVFSIRIFGPGTYTAGVFGMLQADNNMEFIFSADL